jgi:glutamine cyclotransferase
VAIENPASEESVLNGIAFVKSSGLFYITGKNWKKLFLVKIP